MQCVLFISRRRALLQRGAQSSRSGGNPRRPGRAAFEATADRFFAEPRRSIDGWETAAVAQARIVAAVDHVLAASPPGDVAIVAHGGGGTLLQCALRGVISRALDQPSQGHWFAFVRESRRVLHGWRRLESHN